MVTLNAKMGSKTKKKKTNGEMPTIKGGQYKRPKKLGVFFFFSFSLNVGQILKSPTKIKSTEQSYLLVTLYP